MMNSKEKEKTSQSVRNSNYSQFNTEIRRLNELGDEYLKAEPLWDSDDIRFAELYGIVAKLSKVVHRWKVVANDDTEEEINFWLGELLNDYRKKGSTYESLFQFLYVTMGRRLLNDKRDNKPKGFRGHNRSVSMDENKAEEVPTIISYELWMQNRRIDNEETRGYCDVPDNQDDIIISIIALMIRFVSELAGQKKKTKKQARFFSNSRLYLTRYMLTGARSYDYAKRSVTHETELVSLLDMDFIIFCMLDRTSKVYNTLIDICTGRLGKYHDMTKERAPFKPYLSYDLDEWITDEIQNSVVSSYLYSIDRKGKDGGALSTNRITEIFKGVEDKLKIKYIQGEASNLDDKETR